MSEEDKNFEKIFSEKLFKPIAFGFPFIALVLPKSFSKLKPRIFNNLSQMFYCYKKTFDA